MSEEVGVDVGLLLVVVLRRWGALGQDFNAEWGTAVLFFVVDSECASVLGRGGREGRPLLLMDSGVGTGRDLEAAACAHGALGRCGVELMGRWGALGTGRGLEATACAHVALGSGGCGGTACMWALWL